LLKDSDEQDLKEAAGVILLQIHADAESGIGSMGDGAGGAFFRLLVLHW
jgi:hypothetical protein